MTEEAFDAFYAASFSRVVSQIHAMCGNLAEAQDCTQEAFVRAWDRRRQLDESESPEAWVRTVAYRLAVSRWRKTRRGFRQADRAMEDRESAQPSPTRVALDRALAQLPEVLEVTGLSGATDLLVHVVATDADHLWRITEAVLGIPGVQRVDTALAMRRFVDRRTTPLLERAARPR